MCDKPYIIGVTGGIGSGKSVVSHLLRLMGVPVYDCDSEAKRLMCDSAAIREALVNAVGDSVYDVQGQLDRKYLASFMFGNAERVNLINRIVHPVVRADFRAWAQHSAKEIVAVESAILFEAGMHDDVDAVWVVHAPEDMRLQRAVRRDTTNEELVRNRMKNQMSEGEYAQHADVVLHNDGKHSLIAQIRTALEQQTKYGAEG